MIATRFNPLGKKFAFDAKSYVQDGLIFQLDAIENVAFGAHDNTARVWTDLIGGLQVPLANTYAFDEDRLHCDLYDAIPPSIASPFGTMDETTLEVAFLSEFNETIQNAFIICLGAQGQNPSYLAGTRVANGFSKAGDFTYGYARYGAPRGVTGFADGEKVSVSFSRSASDLAAIPPFYKNGELLTESSGWNGSGMTAKISIGRNNSDNGAFTGDLYAVRLYNRTLTDEERELNLAIDKSRYGI